MRIEHIALYVQDLERMKQFYIDYFDATAGSEYHNPKTGLRTYFLVFEDGARLELMSRPDTIAQEKSLLRTGYIHLAFCAGDKAQVDRITAQLEHDGYRILSGPRTTGDGYYESCVLDPEKNVIEITA